MNISYRSEIDALRAFAVLSVVLYHLFPSVFPGGFIGVDIFFVISGYLISRIIFSHLSQKKFNFADFYARRIKRIFPALIFVLLLTWAYGYLVLFPYNFKVLGKHVMGASTFLSNYILYQEIGYFDATSKTKPLLHLWSLAIEEQFYIIWPIGCWIGWKLFSKNPQIIFITILLLTFFSYMLFIFFHLKNPSLAFYFPLSRFWELSCGGLIACTEVFNLRSRKLSTFISQLNANVIELSVLLLLSGLVFFSSDNRSFYPYLIGLTTCCACVFINSEKPTVIKKILSWKPLILIGLISYPFYLFHWPLIGFFNSIDPSLLSFNFKLGLLFGSALLGWIFFYTIERPVRRLRSIFLPYVLIAGLAVCLILGLLVFKDFLNPLVINLFPSSKKITDAFERWDYPPSGWKHFNFKNHEFYFPDSLSAEESILFIGDSNMQQYAPSVSWLAENKLIKQKPIFIAHGGRCPIINVGRKEDDLKWIETALEYSHLKSVKTVVIAASWVGYMNSSTYFYMDGIKKIPLSTLEGKKKGLFFPKKNGGNTQTKREGSFYYGAEVAKD